jgi:hypothetical protein
MTTTATITTATEPRPAPGRVSRRLRLAASVFAVLVAVTGLVSAPLHPAAAAAASIRTAGSKTGGPKTGGSKTGGPKTGTSASADAGGPTTLGGTGAFSSLQVTVSQTQDLINQNVSISWTGGSPTVPAEGTFDTDYLQIMQCWGDEATGPDPSQCEFGAGSATGSLGGSYVNTRQMTYPGLVDPKETDVPPNYSNNPLLYMPFSPAPSAAPAAPYTRPPLTGDALDAFTYFDDTDSNEVDYGRTDANGTGNLYFEMDTNREAPGLGCGQAVTDPAVAGKSEIEPCWLVVVPRGVTEVNGTTVIGTQTNNGLQSSPLSATNWANRIVFPLTFQPAASACTIGADEVEVVGDEQAAQAISHWQPGLCADNPTSPYSFADIGDDESRSQLTSGAPGLDLVSDPLETPAGQTAPDVLYAPVAIDALTISFYIQSQGGTTPATAAQNGVQITQLNLNARLVAKLLTQSYQKGVGVIKGSPTDVPSQNPADLTSDPEFLALNPQFRNLSFADSPIPDIIVPFGNADAYIELWNWVFNDPAARAFLDGVPDNQGTYGNPAYSGMAVNPNYFKFPLPIEDFPTIDPWCQPPQPTADEGIETPLCGIALHPYSTDLNAGAQAASEGSQLLRVTWGEVGSSGTYDWGTTPAESSGDIGILALTDAASAAQYDLPTARLCDDAAGGPGPAGALDQDCQGPTTAALEAAATDAQPSPYAPSVLVPNPNTVDPSAYPLTTITYAATVPSELTPEQGTQYANLLTYVSGPGQVPGLAPGDLAPGYAPLPSALAAQTQAAALFLQDQAGVTPTPPGGGTGLPTGGLGDGDTIEPGVIAPFQVPSLPTEAAPPTGGAKPGKVVRESLPDSALAGASATLPDPVGAIRYVLLICLLLAGVGFGAGPALLAHSRRASGQTPPRARRLRRPPPRARRPRRRDRTE